MRQTRRHDAGFTLLEMLVTLSIVATLASVTLFAFSGASRGEGPEAEARRLAARLQAAVDRSLVTGTPLALEWDARRYGFVVWNTETKTWDSADAPLLSARTLPPALRVDTTGGEQRTAIGGDAFGPPLIVSIASDTRAWQVRFDGIAATASPVLR